ncbi:aldolase class I [Babesia gibsoni]|uniref:Triosephosphate isomerase n=1 Tax=Babesia gibsoni TaxID=33632 RepID=A0AAD8PDA9_BABGI|nr:aldolase class I [Babesia gibsoni]
MPKHARHWVGGNWKCHGTCDGLAQLLEQFNGLEFDPAKTEVVIFPSALHVALAVDKLDKNKFEVGVQNLSQKKCGAFTGEIAVPMVKDLGVNWMLIGHSERRSKFAETDEVVAEKVKLAQEEKVKATVCIGETLEEREAGRVAEVITRQMKAFMEHVTDWELVVVAYEPVWAIGTGKVAMPEQVKESHQLVRDLLTEHIGALAETVRVVYGGSVTEENCGDLIDVPNVDGFLVGGKSLTPAFTNIITVAQKE